MKQLESASRHGRDKHPIIREQAILPNTAIQDSVGAIVEGARKSRSSHALWADPAMGKSSCVDALGDYSRQLHPYSGVMRYEAIGDQGAAEGRLLEGIFLQLALGANMVHSLSAKRNQLHRELYALSGLNLTFFELIDETQGLSIQALIWLKSVIKKLVNWGMRVCMVLMGQRELREPAVQVKRHERSDLAVRFFKRLVDAKSKLPCDSGWTHIQLLFPPAFEAGFWLEAKVSQLWQALTKSLANSELDRGVSMDVGAAYLAQLCLRHKDHDGQCMKLDARYVSQAVREALI